jgi:hypothetical protein
MRGNLKALGNKILRSIKLAYKNQGSKISALSFYDGFATKRVFGSNPVSVCYIGTYEKRKIIGFAMEKMKKSLIIFSTRVERKIFNLI